MEMASIHEPMAIGTVYSSFEELERAVMDYGTAANIIFVKRDCKRIKSFDGKDKDSRDYDHVTFVCKLGGKITPSKSKGFRKLNSIKCGCPVKVRAISFEMGDLSMGYKITQSHLRHNHKTIEMEMHPSFTWESESWAQGWLSRSSLDPAQAFCNFCQRELNPVLKELKRHRKCTLHIKRSKLGMFQDNHSGIDQMELTEHDDGEMDEDLDSTQGPWKQEETQTAIASISQNGTQQTHLTSIPPTQATQITNCSNRNQSQAYTLLTNPASTQALNLTNNNSHSASSQISKKGCGNSLNKGAKLSSSSSQPSSTFSLLSGQDDINSNKSCCKMHNNPMWQQYLIEKLAVKRLEKERVQEELNTQKLMQQYQKLKIKKLLSEVNG